MLNKMDKFDIFVPHPLIITSLLPLECGCKPLVSLLMRPALLSSDFQDRSIRNYSCYIFGEGVVKRRVKRKKKVQKEKGKNNLIHKKGGSILRSQLEIKLI